MKVYGFALGARGRRILWEIGGQEGRTSTPAVVREKNLHRSIGVTLQKCWIPNHREVRFNVAGRCSYSYQA